MVPTQSKVACHVQCAADAVLMEPVAAVRPAEVSAALSVAAPKSFAGLKRLRRVSRVMKDMPIEHSHRVNAIFRVERQQQGRRRVEILQTR